MSQMARNPSLLSSSKLIDGLKQFLIQGWKVPRKMHLRGFGTAVPYGNVSVQTFYPNILCLKQKLDKTSGMPSNKIIQLKEKN